MRPFKDRGEGASGMTPPLIDRSKVAASLLLRCDQSASVSIYVTGLPFPQVTWYLGSRPIVDSDEFRVARDADGRKQSLVVARVTEDLEGGLKVKAVNCAGQDQWEFEIKTYKLFSGRSQPDGNKSTTLPLLQPKGRRKGSSTPSPKSLHKKTNKRFEMTQDEYENWQKEMERRSHMRSIDDILESLSDEDSDAVQSPSTENKRKSEDHSFAMETHPSSSSATDSFASPPPPPTRHATSGSFQEQLSSESRTRDFGFRDSPPVGTDKPASRRPEDSLRITQGSKSTTETRDIPRASLENDIPIWEMFGVKLSEFCRTILDSNAGNFVDRQSSYHGTIHGSTIQTRDNYFAEETSRPSKPQSHSVPVGRKALGSRLAENQTKPVFPENTRIPISKERMGQQKAATVRPLSADPAKPVALMPGGGGSPNLRPPVHPKGDATQRVMQMLEGSGSSNTRPPLAPKPSFNKEERQMRGTADQGPKTSDISGSFKSDSFVASLSRHRAEAEASNSNSKFTPNAQASQVRRATASNSSDPRGSAWEPSEKDALLQRTSSLDRGQNLVQWGPAVDRHFAEVRGDNQRPRLEIKMPTTTRAGGEPSDQILETHFNEPSSEARSSQRIPEALITNREPVSELPINDKADRIKADSIAFPTQSDVIRKKPPIAKDKPSWNPATGAKGRGIPRTCPALPSKAPEHLEPGSKQNLWSQPTVNSEPPSIPSKPTLVRRARSQSSGRSDEMAISCEEEEDTSGYLYGATSAVQLSYNQENPTQGGAEQSRQSGIGRFQASAAKSEGLLTARKLSASPTGDGAVNLNGSSREWRVRMPVSKSVDLLDAANSVEAMQRIGRRSLSKEWQVVTVTTKEEITILQRPATATGVTKVTSPTAYTTTTKDHGFTYRPQLRPSKPFAV